MNMVWGLKADAMTTVQRFVLLALADTADDDGHCFPSTAYLDHKTGMSNRNVRRHLDQLEAEGWFKRARRSRTSGYTYVIDLDRLEAEQGLTWRQKRQEREGHERTVSATPSGQFCPVTSGQFRSPERTVLSAHNHQENPRKNRQATTPPLHTVRMDSAEEKTNRFPGVCIECGKQVKAGQGLLVGKKVVHRTGQCVLPAHIVDPAALKDEDFKL